jgi:hypothetical protein
MALIQNLHHLLRMGHRGQCMTMACLEQPLSQFLVIFGPQTIIVGQRRTPLLLGTKVNEMFVLFIPLGFA